MYYGNKKKGHFEIDGINTNLQNNNINIFYLWHSCAAKSENK